MHFDHSKIFVTKFALKFIEFQMFQPSARPSAFGCIDLWQPKAKLKVRKLQLQPKTFGLRLHRPSATEGEPEGEKPSTSAEDLQPSVDH